VSGERTLAPPGRNPTLPLPINDPPQVSALAGANQGERAEALRDTVPLQAGAPGFSLSSARQTLLIVAVSSSPMGWLSGRFLFRLHCETQDCCLLTVNVNVWVARPKAKGGGG